MAMTLEQARQAIIDRMQSFTAVSYTHLTMPTNKEGGTSGGGAPLTQKKNIRDRQNTSWHVTRSYINTNKI
ncbi:hypothetical protein [Acinetobacter baumannii]|uniref:hypothetical protein n=1 Tax=Acinetobacter baumannii TaxID=470 RepID=UPI0006AC8E4F|nr:hypothetical protein [Acinetobacter baumannii]KOP84423.1 hypothetical protein AKG96_19550 [Acinetobacter baumannii]